MGQFLRPPLVPAFLFFSNRHEELYKTDRRELGTEGMEMETRKKGGDVRVSCHGIPSVAMVAVVVVVIR